ncbi:MAG: protein kinase [Deltaproteobacteria bacterium]|nr:protein kinase [Deltaproteobacteria bacterium]
MSTPPIPTRSPAAPELIAGRYRVDRMIARGGMGVVYLAHQDNLKRPVALKILTPPEDSESPETFIERFRLEAETLAALDHPHIVTLFDFGRMEDGRFFLAMEYIDGPRLTDLLKDGPLAPDRALRLLYQVATALRYAHKRGVIHRDLKPSNLLIRTDEEGREQVKVVDFGLVKLAEDDQSLTRAGFVLGSPHCMAPEQVKGKEVDHRADVYAVGVLLYRTITGHYPFHGNSSTATMIAHVQEPIPSFYAADPNLIVPAGLEPIVRRCLAKAPGARYPDMSALLEDLTALFETAPEPYSAAASSPFSLQVPMVPAEAPRPRWPWVLVLGGAAIALLLVLALGGTLGVMSLLWEPTPDTPPAQAPKVELPTPDEAAPTPPAQEEPGTPQEEPGTPAPASPGPGSLDPGSLDPPRVDRPPAVTAPPPGAAEPRPEVPGRPPSPRPDQASVPEETPPPAEAPQEPSAPEGYMGLPEDF